MKQTLILATGLFFVTAILISSCTPSKVWATKEKNRKIKDNPDYYERRDEYVERYRQSNPPPSYVISPLILSPTPGFVMNKHSNGRFYHRSPMGFIYWKGIDNRFYMDRSFINRVKYDRWEYEKWLAYQDINQPGY